MSAPCFLPSGTQADRVVIVAGEMGKEASWNHGMDRSFGMGTQRSFSGFTVGFFSPSKSSDFTRMG